MKKKLVAMAVAVGLALTAGSAIAASAHGGRGPGGNLDGVLTGLKDKGTLTQSQIDAIKKAIVMKNAETVVKIGQWEGTIAEAIEYKNSITYKQSLLDQMKEHVTRVKARFEEEKHLVDNRLERLLQSELGKDVRTNPETITALTTSFRENNKVELVDPLNLAAKAKELEEEIEGFLTNVDWVLSEANGRTMIRV